MYLRFADKYLTRLYIDEINRDLLDTIGHDKLKTGVQLATVNRMMEVIPAILNKAEHDWQWLDRAPAVRMLKEPRRRIRWITTEDAERLMANVPDHLEVMARRFMSYRS